jgi:hypothetical protein
MSGTSSVLLFYGWSLFNEVMDSGDPRVDKKEGFRGDPRKPPDARTFLGAYEKQLQRCAC